jgi:tRNA(Ile2) C34 agmatinyltransferase TiaS
LNSTPIGSAGGASTNVVSSLGGASFASVNQTNLSNVKVTAQAQSASYNDAGITVAGSKSDQKFSEAAWFPVLPEKHSIVLKLLGETPDNKPVLQPVTVKAKPVCSSCGKHNKATASFCSACGTALEIFA